MGQCGSTTAGDSTGLFGTSVAARQPPSRYIDNRPLTPVTTYSFLYGIVISAMYCGQCTSVVTLLRTYVRTATYYVASLMQTAGRPVETFPEVARRTLKWRRQGPNQAEDGEKCQTSCCCCLYRVDRMTRVWVQAGKNWKAWLYSQRNTKEEQTAADLLAFTPPFVMQ